MKKLTLLAIFVILAFSTRTKAQGVKFGVYFAPQFSWLSPEGKNIEQDGSIVKFAGGLIVDNYFTENYAFSSGISIGAQGGKLAYKENSRYTLDIDNLADSLINKAVKYNFQYISIPLDLKLQSNEIGYLKFHVIVGFTNQFRIKAKATDLTADIFEDYSIKDQINVYNLSYHFGGGVDYALGEDTSVFLTLVYENGFIDIFKSGANQPSINSRILSVRIGINF